MLGGSTSGTPPTFVLTTNSPHLCVDVLSEGYDESDVRDYDSTHDAASRIAMQKLSVREQFRKM
jgi:hypothetical protein